ncbi:thioredoxin-like protein, partial [Mycena metata]
MVLKLYAGANAPGGGTCLVALVLAEKRLPFELIIIDLSTKANKTPEFLAMHPFGQVPVLDDNGFILYEGRAICRYLAEKHYDRGTPGPLIPKVRALFEQAASVEFTNFYPAVAKIATEAIAKPSVLTLPAELATKPFSHKLSAMLNVYEVILGKHRFLASYASRLEFTPADLFHLMVAPVLALLVGLDIMTSKGPNVAR